MKSKFVSVLILFAIAAAPTTARAQSMGFGPDRDSILRTALIDKATDEDAWEGELGFNWRAENPDEGDDGSAGWGYLDLFWESGSMYGFQVGAGALATLKAWDDDPINLDDLFQDEAVWTQIYVTYTIPDTKTRFLLGRADDGMFGEPNGGDGDYYQGFGIISEDIPRITLKAHAVNEWINDASASWDFDGIQEDWQEMDDVIREVGGESEDSGDFAYTLIAAVDVIPDRLEVTPHLQYQKDVALSLGLSLEGEIPINENFTVGGEGVYLYHFEDTPDSVNSDDEDLSQTLISIYGKFKGLKAGFGFYTMSDDVPIFNTIGEGGDDFEDVFVMDEIDPMEEDLAKYGEQPNNKTWYVYAEYGYGPFDLGVIYGWVDDAIVEDGLSYDGKAQELDVFLDIGLTENLSAELVYINLQDDYADDGDRSMDVFAGSFAYSF